jgi:hypothetical protein
MTCTLYSTVASSMRASRPISQVPWYDAQPPRMSAPQDLRRAETRPLLDRKRANLLRCLFCNGQGRHP